MCGRYTSRTPAADLAEYFGVDEVIAPELGERFNVAPTDEVYAIAEHDDERRLGTFRWGLVPFWAKDLKVGAKMINARAETLLEKSAFRRPFERRRCIIPADGFYEWERVTTKHKQPWYIRRADGKPLAFAGMWDSWRPSERDARPERPSERDARPERPSERDARPERPSERDDGKVRSCVIITGEPNEKVARLHDRMPVMLPPEAWDRWLDPANDDLASLASLLVPAPAELFDLVPVSTAVNTVTNDGPALIDRVEPATLL